MEAEYRKDSSLVFVVVTTARRTGVGGREGIRDSWRHPPNTPAANRKTRTGGLFQLRLGFMKRITALLLTKCFLKICARAPIFEDCLTVVVLRIDQGRLLLYQITQQRRLL